MTRRAQMKEARLLLCAMTLCQALAGLSPTVAQEPTQQRFSIEEIRPNIEPGAEIGRKSVGLICAPDGALRWGDGLAVVDQGKKFSAIVRSELDGSELSDGSAAAAASLFSEAEGRLKAPFAIGAEIVAIQFDICHPNILWRRGKVKGEGQLQIRWHIYSNAQRKIIHTMTTDCQATSSKADASFASLFEKTLRLCTRKFRDDAAVRAALSTS